MTTFSNDVDLLKLVRELVRELAWASQTLCAGSDGVLSGTTLMSAGGSFEVARVKAGHVVYLNDGADLDGCYEIVSADSATQLTVSVVRQSSDDAAVAAPSGSGVSYRVSTFDPQAEEVAYGLLQYFGIESGQEDAVTAEQIVDGRSLRQTAVCGVLAAVFAASACGEGEGSGHWKKSLHYKQLFHTARTRARVGIDTDGDGVGETVLSGGTVRLRRL